MLPVYIANFVLIDYGTGAIFGCPAHDTRDYEFAVKYNLPIVSVIKPSNTITSNTTNELPYTEDGILCNSDFLNDLSVNEAKKVMIDKLESLNIGAKKITYRLRDWLISRQRYWGCPIPIIHCPKCGEIPAELPVYLPDDVEFKDLKGNPLEHHSTWKYVKCPKCGNDALRDTDTLDTFFDSSWYFLRYLDSHNNQPINKELTDKALPVDMYVGGIEHAVLHLLYARFFTLVLRDLGYINKSIPFMNLLTQGMVCHKLYKNINNEYIYPSEVERNEQGQLIDSNNKLVKEYPSEKMSKSKKNIINPQEIMDAYGIDALRLFILSDTPPEKDFDWNTDALDGAWRFMNRIWKVFSIINTNAISISTNNTSTNNTNTNSTDLECFTHIYIKKIEENYESLSLNKAIALARELFNKIESNLHTSSKKSLLFAFESFIKLFSPITPFICHEIWKQLGHENLIRYEKWPEYDSKLSQIDKITLPVQVNGKLRKTIEITKDTEKSKIEDMALEVLNIDKTKVKKIIVVPNRIVNIVVI